MIERGPYCPLSGRLQACTEEKCRLWDKDAKYKGKTGMCGINKLIRDIGEIREKIK